MPEDTRVEVNGFDAIATANAENLPAGSGTPPPTRANVNGYDCIVVSDQSSGGSLPPDALRGGWANYVNGDQTPINIQAGVETKLTLTTVGGVEREEYLPIGVSGLWDSVNSQFDFSSLNVGDMIDFRIDGSLTNSGLNESFVLNLVAGIGTPSEFTLPISSGNRLFAGTSIVSRYNGIFIGSENTRTAPAELRILTTDDASGFLIDIYVKVIKLNG